MNIEEISTILEKYENKTEMVISVLQEIQDKYYYLPKEAIKKVSEKLNVSLSRVYSIATFYNAFSLIPKGKNQVKICLGTTCYIRGGEDILNEVKKDLKINEGETTEDKKFSLEAGYCFGCCSISPVLIVNNDIHGRVREDKVEYILKKYK